ncbi:hypothetical protein N7532_004460 [Penicillium argentinense]|uniref:Uncharacterized protein n=1 Tax=Penicillium argentinense TaxID=1131581 RepID=A0A9W9FPE4_9EURO|nr:uncharacterized protein N7532_004460 [Penicillium argentinense]KAJ5103931.1 hypothetical protein N7532_004460 [Penicillium argentinense]
MAVLFNYLVDVYQSLRGVNSTILTEKDVPGTDLRGKWIIITGSNNGIGLEAAKSFAGWGANLIMGCRDPPGWELHPTAAVKECRDIATAHGHSSTIEWWDVDLTSLESVDAFAERWLATKRPLDILCNNAAISIAPLTARTGDGFQPVHQINYLAHVLITLRLLPSLARSDEPRIVCTTSCYHHLGFFDLTGQDYGAADGTGWMGNPYQNNKLFFQMFVAELQTRLLKHPEYKHITINGVHPGFVASGIWKPLEATGGKLLDLFLRHIAITPQQGSLAITNAATSPELGPDPQTQGVGQPGGRGGGHYLNRIWVAPSKRHCNEPELRAELWVHTAKELQLQEKGLLDVLGL